MTEHADPISEELVETFLTTLQESGSTRDADLVVSFCTPDVVADDHGPSDTLVGREALQPGAMVMRRMRAASARGWSLG